VGFLRYTHTMDAALPPYALAAARNFVSEGDSITANGWAFRAAYACLPGYQTKANVATPGDTLLNLISQIAATDALIVPGARNVMSLLIGANDLNDTATYPTVTNWLTAVKNYCDARRAAGWYLILGTLLPQGFTGGVNSFNTRRATATPEMRLWTTNGSICPGKHADLIVDFAADTILGPDNSSVLNPTYWSDEVHPTQLGYDRMTEIGKQAIGGASAVSTTGVPPASVTRLLSLTPRREAGSPYSSLLAVSPDCRWTLQAGTDVGFTLTSDTLTHPAGSIGSYVANIQGTDAFGHTYTATLTLGVTAIDGTDNIAPNDGHFDSYFRSELSSTIADGTVSFGIEEISGNPAFFLQTNNTAGFPQWPIGTVSPAPVAGARYEISFVSWKNGIGTAGLAMSGADFAVVSPSTSTTPVMVQGTFVQTAATAYTISAYMAAGSTTAGEKGWYDEIEIRRVLGPVLSTGVVTVTGNTTATVSAATTGTTGTMYAVLTTSIKRPTRAQIKAGQNDLGAAAAWGGTAAVTSATTYTINASGLGAGTIYHAHIVHETGAGFSNTVWATGTTTGIAVAGFNGGRSQTGLNTLNNGEFAFMNVLKMGGSWDADNNSATIYPPDLLDANGYPTALFGGAGGKSIFKVPTQTQRPGNYIITWDGNGTIQLSGGGDILGGTASFTGSISGTTLTIPGTVTGTIKMGQRVTGGTTLPYTFIMSGSGTTYTVSKSQTVASVAMTSDNGSKTSTGTTGAGFIVCTGPTDPDDANMTLRLQAFGTPHMTNFKIYHVDDAADIALGKVFGKKFLARLVEANFGVIRFMDWVGSNTACTTTWATRKPINYYSYSANDYRASVYCQSLATRTGPAYTAAPPVGFVLADKAMIHLKWATSYNGTVVTFTSGNPSIAMPAHGLSIGSRLHLSLDGGGALPGGFAVGTKYFVVSVPDSGHITISASSGGTAITPSGVGTQPGQPATANPFLTLDLGAGPVDMLADYCNWFVGSLYPIGNSFESLNTLVYDATLQAWIRFGMGGGGGPTSIGIGNMVPPEICLQLCVEVGAHPYFVAPFLACDPMTDYIPSLAQYCKDNAPAWMIPRFEGPNELWNTAGGFFQTGYAVAKANAYNDADPTHWSTRGDFNNWYGKAMSTIGQAVSTVYANDRTKYHVIGGVQTIKMASAGERAEQSTRFTSAFYVSQTAAAQAPYTKTPSVLRAVFLAGADLYDVGARHAERSRSGDNLRRRRCTGCNGLGYLHRQLRELSRLWGV
jgi:hypothetical protein